MMFSLYMYVRRIIVKSINVKNIVNDSHSCTAIVMIVVCVILNHSTWTICVQKKLCYNINQCKYPYQWTIGDELPPLLLMCFWSYHMSCSHLVMLLYGTRGNTYLCSSVILKAPTWLLFTLFWSSQKSIEINSVKLLKCSEMEGIEHVTYLSPARWG